MGTKAGKLVDCIVIFLWVLFRICESLVAFFKEGIKGIIGVWRY